MSDSGPTDRSKHSMPIYLTALLAGNLAMTIQICITRIAVHRFGSDASTISALVVAALAGLAVGAILVGRLVDSDRQFSRALAVSFGSCGLLSLLVAFQSGGIATVVSDLIGTSNGIPAAVFASVTLFPINVVLGLVLPVLVKRTNVNRFGLVYGMETIGAALGAILAAFVWIQLVGLFRLLIGCSAVALGLGVYYFFERTATQPSNLKNEDVEQNSSAIRIPIIFVVVLTSCASLGMEVVWQRYFVVWFGSDTKSFAIVVASILAGVSFGSMLSAWLISRSKNLLFLYRCSLIAMATSIVGSTLLIIVCFDNLDSLKSSLVWLADFPVVTRFVLALGLLILPTTLFGFGLPLAVAIWLKDSQNVVRSVGQLYCAAVVGNILGVALCGYFLIPGYGLRAATATLSTFCVLGGVIVFVLERIQNSSSSKTPKWISVVFGLIFIGWILLSNIVVNKPTRIGLGDQLKDWEVDYYSENSTSTVAVIYEIANPQHRKMLIDGVSIGESSGGVDEKQQLLAHLPFLLSSSNADASRRQRVLTIGLGSGILAGELAKASEERDVFCVEISPAVIEAASYFSDLNGNLFQQPNFHLIRGDGINFLRNRNEPFDVIVSDAKSRPGHAGNVAFFSRDYYEICDQRLSENGIFVQWISLKSSESAIASILNTFCGVFPFGHVGIVAPDSIFVVGSKQEIEFNKEHITRYLNEPVSSGLGNYDFESFDDILSMYWLDQTSIKLELDGTPINSFDHPILESYSLSSFKQSTQKSTIQLNFIKQLLDREMMDGFEESRLNGVPLKAMENASLLKQLVTGRRASRAVIDANQLILELEDDWLDNAAKSYRKALELLPGLTRQRQVARIYRQLAEKAQSEGKVNLRYSALVNIRELNASTATDELAMAEILQSLERYENALEHFYQAVKKEPENHEFRTAFGYCLLRLGKRMQAASQFKRVLAKSDDSEARIGLGISQLKSGLSEKGIENIRQALDADANLESKLMEYQIENW